MHAAAWGAVSWYASGAPKPLCSAMLGHGCPPSYYHPRVPPRLTSAPALLTSRYRGVPLARKEVVKEVMEDREDTSTTWGGGGGGAGM
jgi:hypothetical protein